MTQRGKDFREGDVILANHPQAGGSHLPDLTVITPVQTFPPLDPYTRTRISLKFSLILFQCQHVLFSCFITWYGVFG